MSKTNYILPQYPHKIDHLVGSSARVSELREWMINEIPCKPDNEDTRRQLREISINHLMAIYVNWADRFIPPYPRQTTVWDGFWTRNNPRAYADSINKIIDKALKGDDLIQYLSPRVHTDGFVPKAGSRKGINWGDKDMALNSYDVHHLHLVPANEKGKRKGGSKELLYVGVSREELLLLMLGDHNSFNDGTLAQAVAEHKAQAGQTLNGVVGLSRDISAEESQKLARRGVSTAMMVDGAATIGAMISTAGTSAFHTMHVDRCCETIEIVEEVLDDRGRLLDCLKLTESDIPSNPKWAWQFHYANLYLVDVNTSTAYTSCPWRR